MDDAATRSEYMSLVLELIRKRFLSGWKKFRDLYRVYPRNDTRNVPSLEMEEVPKIVRDNAK
jgi:hypothetical protein